MDHPIPNRIELLTRSKALLLSYAGQELFRLDAEYLRVYSPSAEVRGHGAGQARLQTGKRHVAITGIEPVGNYGLKLIFDDGHDTGIYSWSYLWELCRNRQQYWQDYLDRLAAAGARRDP